MSQSVISAVLMIVNVAAAAPEQTSESIAKSRLESLYNQPITSNDVQYAERIIEEIDRISLSDMPDEQKRSLISEQTKQFSARWWTKGKYEKALLLIKLSNEVKSRDAWIVCITLADHRGDARCIDPMKKIIETNSNLDSKQRHFLYDGIAVTGGTNELAFLQQEYPKAHSYGERFILAAHLANMGDKTGVPTLIEAYERRSDSNEIQEWLLQKLRTLYGEDYGNDIAEWKKHVLPSTNNVSDQ